MSAAPDRGTGPLVKRNLAVLAALLLCATAHGQTSASTAPASPSAPDTGDNALDSARRELKELPAAERTRDVLAKPSSLGSSGLPTLTLPGDAGGAAPRPGANQPPSATWLQDAAGQVDAEAAANRRAADSSLPRDSSDRAGGYKPAETPNPLGQYLQQWISPRDMELWRAGQETKNPGELSPPPATPAHPGDALAPGGALWDSARTATGADPVVPVLGVTRNPYIDDAELILTAPPPNAISPQATPGLLPADRGRAPGALPPTVSAAPVSPATPQQPNQLKPATTPAEPPPRPPTAPLVDDRKYFPQLRRF